uniref:Pentraxin (PTX) domain-containing protein n=1 Tax=Naja naja TaxID=35670 RepID=A0A8C6Y905_NAJNA
MEKDRLLLCTVLLIFSVPGIFTNTDLGGKAFVFSKLSANSHVLLKPNLDQSLRQLTLCLRFFTDLTRSFSLFSAASRYQDNEILLWRNPHGFEVCVGGECAVFIMPNPSDRSAIRWRLPRKGSARGSGVKTDLMVMLGLEQDSYGGCFDVKQSFVGEIAEVSLWDKVLTAKGVNKTQLPGASKPLLDWTSLKFQIQGDIVIIMKKL